LRDDGISGRRGGSSVPCAFAGFADYLQKMLVELLEQFLQSAGFGFGQSAFHVGCELASAQKKALEIRTSLGSECKRLSASVARARHFPDETALRAFVDGTANRNLIHKEPVADFLRRDSLKAADERHQPPLWNADIEILRVFRNANMGGMPCHGGEAKKQEIFVLKASLQIAIQTGPLAKNCFQMK
jgi:hypothetical protein